MNDTDKYTKEFEEWFAKKFPRLQAQYDNDENEAERIYYFGELAYIAGREKAFKEMACEPKELFEGRWGIGEETAQEQQGEKG